VIAWPSARLYARCERPHSPNAAAPGYERARAGRSPRRRHSCQVGGAVFGPAKSHVGLLTTQASAPAEACW